MCCARVCVWACYRLGTGERPLYIPFSLFPSFFPSFSFFLSLSFSLSLSLLSLSFLFGSWLWFDASLYLNIDIITLHMVWYAGAAQGGGTPGGKLCTRNMRTHTPADTCVRAWAGAVCACLAGAGAQGFSPRRPQLLGCARVLHVLKRLIGLLNMFLFLRHFFADHIVHTSCFI